MEERVNTYDASKYGVPAPGPAPGGPKGPDRPRRKHRKIIVFLIVLAVIAAAAVITALVTSDKGSGDTILVSENGTIDCSEDYIGRLDIQGTISESGSSGLLESSTYHHQWLLDRISEMEHDSHNKGIILYLNTPGGSVYAADELYNKIKEYQAATHCPVYSYMASEAASGGYYISAPADRIIANRNCWTGSIGVTLGTMYDVTGLLKKLGVKTVTITSGRNKAMGSPEVEMTKEQREILQGLVDEAYDQFVGIVSEGRNMNEKKVRRLADGRIYTAKQAYKLGLVDQVDDYTSAVKDLKTRYNLHSIPVKNIQYDEDPGLVESILGVAARKMHSTATGSAENARGNSADALSEYEELRSLISGGQTFTVAYLSQIRK